MTAREPPGRAAFLLPGCRKSLWLFRQPEECRYFCAALRHENSRFAPRSKYPWGAPRTPCKARLCATFDLIRGGLCPLEFPLRKETSDPIERVYRQAERRAAGRRPFFVCPLRPRCARPPLPKGEARDGGCGFPRQCAPQGHLLRGEHWLGMTGKLRTRPR